MASSATPAHPCSPELAQRLRAALRKTTESLLAARTPDGHWAGELSSSALSTATAVTALAVAARDHSVTGQTSGIPSLVRTPHSALQTANSHIEAGLNWLAQQANADGGWGDTIRSISNLSTTTLVWAAFGAVPGADARYRKVIAQAEAWLKLRAGGLEPERLAPAVIERYGKDRTFSVPILTMCALAGRLGSGRGAWDWVIPLPFELAACPRSWFAALRLPVVSYALPALIAIGQARHYHAPSRNPLVRWLRNAARLRTLRVLTEIQPSNGGFLEATPLTSFVTMSLAGSGQTQHPVTRKGLEFLQASQRPDGSWPIDTNLCTWLTTLSINALVSGAQAAFNPDLLRWLVGQQYRQRHPYTNAAPGGWAWTDLPGGVPDADDTAGAVLALSKATPCKDCIAAAKAGVRWLLDVQNADGGIPTFCRGWGALPFDRSSPDITAHAIRAWTAWERHWPEKLGRQIQRASARAREFLLRTQRHDGAWVPLWFGNQLAPNDENPVYGTSRVLLGFAAPEPKDVRTTASVQRALAWLCAAQKADGSWGGGREIAGSVEETAWALEALAVFGHAPALPGHSRTIHSALARGTAWLLNRVEEGTWTEPAPVGFYFARLWYFEQLYPVLFTTGALNRVAQAWGISPEEENERPPRGESRSRES